jgi:NhaP-type Na+/H+ or K+/H+ antiporter
VTIALGTIVVLGVGAQWLGRITGIPTVVLLLLGGILAGPVTGVVEPEELLGDTLDPAVTLAVSLLLFDSGFALNLRRRPKGVDVVYRLVSVGMLVTWAIGAGASYLIFDMSASVAVMLGVVLVVSGPTVVGPIVKASRPRGSTGKLLEWEGTILDPVGATLGATTLTVITNDSSGLLEGLGILVATIALGIGVGLLCAAVFVIAWRNYAIPDDLQVPVAFMFAVLAYTAAAAFFSEAGLFATLTLGLALANQRYASVARVRRFEANIGTLVIATLFIVLAATIDLSELGSVVGPSAVLLAVLVLVARPLATLASSLGSPLDGPDRAFVASVAPRGIVAASTVSYYAFSLQDSGIDPGDMVPATFAIIIGAGVIYGFGSPWMARWLGVSRDAPKGVAMFGRHDGVADLANELAGAGVPVLVVDHQAPRGVDESDRAYVVFTGDVLSDELIEAMEAQDVGSTLVGTGDRGIDFVALKRSSRHIGKKRTHYIPRRKAGEEGEVEARWRARTPSRFVAFGPDITRDALHEALGPGGTMAWTSIDGDEPELPAGAIPLFIVRSDGRAAVATGHTLEEARGTSGTRLLWARPARTEEGET